MLSLLASFFSLAICARKLRGAETHRIIRAAETIGDAYKKLALQRSRSLVLNSYECRSGSVLLLDHKTDADHKIFG